MCFTEAGTVSWKDGEWWLLSGIQRQYGPRLEYVMKVWELRAAGPGELREQYIQTCFYALVLGEAKESGHY